MATFEFNNGNLTDLEIDSKYLNTKIYISVNLKADAKSIKFAGRARITCLTHVTKSKVIFNDHALGYANELYGKSLLLKIDATKFNPKEDGKKASETPLTCELIVEAGDDLIKKYNLSDSEEVTVNSIFIYKIIFKKVN